MLYDVIIVGSSTSGAFLARTMAEKGFSVKVIERDSLGNVGRKMDIVHIAKADFSKFDLPIVTSRLSTSELSWLASPLNL